MRLGDSMNLKDYLDMLNKMAERDKQRKDDQKQNGRIDSDHDFKN